MPLSPRKKCQVLSLQHARPHKGVQVSKGDQNEGKNEKETNTVTAEGGVVIICDDGCVSLETQHRD